MNIKELRLNRKMTQVDVARAVGVTIQAYRWWEQGVGKPKPENLIKLKKVFPEYN